MRHLPIDPSLFAEHRERLASRMAPNSLAVVNANDLLPRNSDALNLIVPQTDLFYLTGIEQEETVLL
ncbi:MAG TPA: aminopeptidase P N-terminal domain-containing protein, partial [Burkholderiales bacterium]|nr:aminopeptidase P N-terminal domain-containing protein [Burkholderiales bacterium]